MSQLTPDPATESRQIAQLGVTVVAFIALVLAGGALIVGAGSSGPRAGDAPVAAGDAVTIAEAPVTVELSEFALSPAAIEVAAGGTLEVVNVGSAPHDLTIVDAGLATPVLNGGQSATLDVSGLEPGTYDVVCDVPGHAAGGMTGTLTVTEGGATTVAATDAGDHGGHGADTDWASLDAAMHDTILEFPAETAAHGNQPLEPTILDDGTKRFELTAEIIEWEVAPGEWVEGWAYNGQIPGPMIRTDVGDRVEIEVTNELPMGTDVHWHGIHVPNDQDGVAPLT